jgi:putative Mn2+ efflux pump MntP
MGVVSAIMKFGGINFVNEAWFESHSAEILALVMLAVICTYFIWDSLRGKPDKE